MINYNEIAPADDTEDHPMVLNNLHHVSSSEGLVEPAYLWFFFIHLFIYFYFAFVCLFVWVFSVWIFVMLIFLVYSYLN